jgi:hypothetical protein
MVSKCANPTCHAPFLYLRNGRLVAVERVDESNATSTVEFFWLCGDCARCLTLKATSSGVDVVPCVQTRENTNAEFLRLSRTWRATACAA